jgi:hypothetical protein
MAKKAAHRSVLLITAVVLLLAACATSGSEMRDPFSARSESEKGIVVEWSGYTEGYQPGHQPGQHHEVYLRFENESDEKWRGKYCIQLLDSQDVVAILGQREFVLDPSAGMGTPHVLNLPDGLAEGAYALTLVVHRPQGAAVNSVTIQVGDTSETYHLHERAYQAALEACTPV